jgi:hypothetical protein
MKTKLLFALYALACASLCARPVEAQVYTGTALQNSGGNIARIVPFAPVTVCVATDTAVPCTQKAVIFTDETLSTQCTASGGNGAPLSGAGCNNPGLADANGNFTLFATPGVYRVCTFAQNYQCVKVSTGGSSGGGFVCGTTPTPGLLYWTGTACASDTGATFDPVNLVWNFEAIVSAGTITAPKFATSGAGGILEMNAQSPPGSVPLNKFDLFINTGTGQIACLNNALTSCLATVQTVASGTSTMGTGAITSGACATAVTATATGTAATDRILATPNVDPTGVTGYAPSASGSLYIQAFPTANTVSFKVCNNTGSTITPAALTLNWAVIR